MLSCWQVVCLRVAWMNFKPWLHSIQSTFLSVPLRAFLSIPVERDTMYVSFVIITGELRREQSSIVEGEVMIVN